MKQIFRLILNVILEKCCFKKCPFSKNYTNVEEAEGGKKKAEGESRRWKAKGESRMQKAEAKPAHIRG